MSDSDASSTFPNKTDTVAEFRPHSATIHMHDVSRPDLESKIANNQHAAVVRPLSVLIHELTHWLDLSSTVWGQEYVIALFDAYEAALNNPLDERKFWKVIRLYDEDRRIMFPNYYHVVSTEDYPHNPQHPWTISHTCGQEFAATGRIDTSRPIFFVVFGHNPDGRRIARQPISVGTLLETVATWSETITGAKLIERIPDAGEREVERVLWQKERTKTLYDAKLTNYTAPVHMLSVIANTQEAMLSYHISAMVARVCLNMTDEHFRRLRIPSIFNHFGAARLKAFRAARDRGFAFASIVFGAPKYGDINSPDEWLALALKKANLPEVGVVNNSALKRLEEMSSLPLRWELDKVRDYLLEVGRRNFQIRAGLPATADIFEMIQRGIMFPTFFDANMDIGVVGNTVLDPSIVDPCRMFDRETELRKFSRNFLVGCRGLQDA